MKQGIPLMDLTPSALSGLTGPGTQRGDDGLSYLPMPHEMNIFEPPALPEPGALATAPAVLQLLERLQAPLDDYCTEQPCAPLALEQLSASECKLLQQILGEGEVAVQLGGDRPLVAQESVLAGVWWVREQVSTAEPVSQWLEVAAIPARVRQEAFSGCTVPSLLAADVPAGLTNGAPVLIELLDQARAHAAQTPAKSQMKEPHVVNLSLLPFSAEDHAFLQHQLGQGAVLILSRGYGNCRITATAISGIWRVQYFNSTDQLILDTLEVTDMPQVACAALEDLQDSADRLREIREALA